MKGEARICERPLNTGKSDRYGRSHGFFVRVRGRVINLDDPLFGSEELSYAPWSRFALEADVDGLRSHLLSSREGVRENTYVAGLREYLVQKFNECRRSYDAWVKEQVGDLDLVALLSEKPSGHVTEPLVRSVRSLLSRGTERFYVDPPRQVDVEGRGEWLESFEADAGSQPFAATKFENRGVGAPALRYDPTDRTLFVNLEHPYVARLVDRRGNRNAAKLFAFTEVLVEGQLEEHGVDEAAISDFLRDRDRVLRLMTGEDPLGIVEVTRLLRAAVRDKVALERATGHVFQSLGFEYEKRGGTAAGPDGVLTARLGRQGDVVADYKLVYDAKQTNNPSVPAAKIKFDSLADFCREEGTELGFFVAKAYHGEAKNDAKINKELRGNGGRFALLKVGHLERLLGLHSRYGVTLTRIRSLFDVGRTVADVDYWLDSLESELEDQGEIPLEALLQSLEAEKRDRKATPHLWVVRAKNPELRRFTPERLVARLKAVETILGERWLEVRTSGEVNLHQTASEIVLQVERVLNDSGEGSL